MNTVTVANNMSDAELRELVRANDAKFETTLTELAEEIRQDRAIRLLGLTGPTCSGKTTAAKMLTRTLETCGRTVHVISVDDFYYGKDALLYAARGCGNGEIDYDSPDTIDLAAMRECTLSLLSGKETRMPRFNFQTGQREPGEVLRPSAGDLFLFEGIQILYPQVDALLRQEGYFNFCVCPQTAIETGGETFAPHEIRLMRRLVRDVRYRAAAPSFTFFLWSGVRRNEETHIFPYIGGCNRTIDSTMPYEVGLLKPYLQTYLSEQDDARYHGEMQAVLNRLRAVQTVPHELIGADSLYKEFI